MAEAMSEERIEHIGILLSAPDVGGIAQVIARELLAELKQARAQLAEIGETREEWGVRVDGCTDTIGVYPGRESAEENLALWRKVWPSSEFTLMQRENRAAVVSGWREVPDA